MINLRQYHHFIATLESASLMEASRKLNISQPALSKSIGALEDFYRVELFHRLPRGVRPTPYALALEHHARRLLHDVSASRDELMEMAQGATGTLSIGVGAAFLQVASDTIRAFERDVPGCQFKVITDQASNLRQALLANRIEFYLGMANVELADMDFDVELLFEDDFVGICSPQHDFAGRTVRAEDCRDMEWIVPDLEEPARAALDAFLLLNLKRKPTVKITTNADHLTRQFLSGTGYISLAPQMTLTMPGYQDFGQFRLQGFAFSRKVGIVRRSGQVSTPLGRRFSDALTENLRALGGPDGRGRVDK